MSTRPTPSLAEQVETEAARFRAQGSALGAFLADELARLAQLIRWTKATTPEDHRDRMEVWEDQVREDAYERGRKEGRDQGLQEAKLVIARFYGAR